jgi:hypothetical protein
VMQPAAPVPVIALRAFAERGDVTITSHTPDSGTGLTQQVPPGHGTTRASTQRHSKCV